MINEFVLRNLYGNIIELSDRTLQYKVWVKANMPDYISSYSELINGFDDCGFDEFVERDIKDYDLKVEFVAKMKELYYLFENYDDERKTDLEIINDPHWEPITELAKEVKKLWEESVLYELMHKPEDDDG